MKLMRYKETKPIWSMRVQQLKEILYFCYSHYVIDLPEFELEAFGDMVSPQQPPMDILRQEGPKLLHLFVKEFNVNLTRSRRIQIFKDIIRYATNRERIFLFQVIQSQNPRHQQSRCGAGIR